MPSGRSRRIPALAAFALSLLVVAASPAAERGWSESPEGWWGSLPERRASFADNGMSLEMTLAPGTGISCERTGAWPSSSRASVAVSVDNVNAGGNDYIPRKAVFPLSVTFVFGKDSVRLGAWPRVALFFRHIWSGFPPSGMRLTYAWGNRVPTGSMYRLEEEETVFVVAGAEEAGRRISTVRRLAEDFTAAYGRAPNGPVTKVLVRARRPSGEKGGTAVRLSLGFPVP